MLVMAQSLPAAGSMRWIEKKEKAGTVRSRRQPPSGWRSSTATSAPSAGPSWRQRAASWWSVPISQPITRPSASLRATSRMVRVTASASYRSMLLRSRRLLAKKKRAVPGAPRATKVERTPGQGVTGQGEASGLSASTTKNCVFSSPRKSFW